MLPQSEPYGVELCILFPAAFEGWTSPASYNRVLILFRIHHDPPEHLPTEQYEAQLAEKVVVCKP